MSWLTNMNIFHRTVSEEIMFKVPRTDGDHYYVPPLWSGMGLISCTDSRTLQKITYHKNEWQHKHGQYSRMVNEWQHKHRQYSRMTT
jgi:hypothetical protein